MTAPLPPLALAVRPVLDPTDLRVLTALCAVYDLSGRATVRDVASASGLPVERVHRHLVALEAMRLVEGLGVRGGLRPALSVVATGAGLFEAVQIGEA